MSYTPYSIYDASQGHLLCNNLSETEAKHYYDNAWRDGISAMQILDQEGNDVTWAFEDNFDENAAEAMFS